MKRTDGNAEKRPAICVLARARLGMDQLRTKLYIPSPHQNRAFSLLEVLVAIAIIGALMLLLLSHLGPAQKVAEERVRKEGFRQLAIHQYSEPDSSGAYFAPFGCEVTRSAFLQRVTVAGTGQESYITEMKYVVRSQEEFAAYYHTLLDKANTSQLEWQGSALVATAPGGGEHLLPPLLNWVEANKLYGRFPVMWEFVSTNPSEMTASPYRVGVFWSDGSVTSETIGDAWPISTATARLGHVFLSQ